MAEEEAATVEAVGEAMSPAAGGEEPAAKKARTSTASISPRERNKYKGMRIRQCLCGKPECLPRLKAWIDLDDSKRQGFKELPRQSSKTTPVGLEKNRIRDVMFLHMKGYKAPKYDESDKTNRERKLFVAFHHFHPLLLQDGNKGPHQYVNFELAERIGGFSERDTVQNLSGIVFHPIPNYLKECTDTDFEHAGGVQQQRYARPRKLEDAATAKPKVSSPSIRLRVRDVLGQMEHDPLKVATDYLEMQERLKKYEEATQIAKTSDGAMVAAGQHDATMEEDDGKYAVATRVADV